ncbi:MAG: DUF4956 domain-containing protein [Candidatus Omnitrophica bacterium]|nr:DUF4956 domain-containing protein [Candidatus Omnitrophota bacterium]
MDSFSNFLLPVGNFNAVTIIGNILFSVIIGIFISLVYIRTHKGSGYSQSFVHTIIIVCFVTTIIMMVIGNNLARAFGLVGALSVIRFRTVVKDNKDTAYILFALALGMAVGVQAHLIALIGALAGAVLITALDLSQFGKRIRTNFLLKFRYDPNLFDDAAFQTMTKEYLVSSALMNISTLRMNELMEMIYDLELKNPGESQQFLTAFKKLPGVEKAQLVSTLSNQEF